LSGVTDGWLSDEDYDRVQRSVPIACVDFVPVRRDAGGAVVQIGLIRRHTPFDGKTMWCHLGGRVNRDETIAEALRRHGQVITGGTLHFDVGNRPLAVMEWFAEPHVTAVLQGSDPRKHSIGLCYVAEAVGEFEARPGSEALAFDWFRPDDVAGLQTWPGVTALIRAVLSVA
jgi:ADP-ribose pyrophosphatase YjhB (NUDIX family)